MGKPWTEREREELVLSSETQAALFETIEFAGEITVESASLLHNFSQSPSFIHHPREALFGVLPHISCSSLPPVVPNLRADDLRIALRQHAHSICDQEAALIWYRLAGDTNAKDVPFEKVIQALLSSDA